MATKTKSVNRISENGHADDHDESQDVQAAEVTSATSGLVRIRMVLKGRLPGYIQQGKGIMEADLGGSATRGTKRTREEEAELLAHWTTHEGKRVLAVPFVQIYKSFIKAAGRFKRINKTSTADVLASAIACEQDKIPLLDKNGKPTDQYECYVEWVRIPPRTGAMVHMGRPLVREWKLDFVVDLDPFDIKAYIVKEIAIMAGRTVGIGAWRPELKGSHGRFTVEKFEVLEG